MDIESSEEQVFRPRLIDTAEYVKARLDQIAEILEVVNSNSGAEEGTSAPRTLFQRLPRHMRRRAMSHNIKRLPRLIRPIAINLRNKKKKKMPSRIWRRRASRLIRRSMVENSKPRWLSTHIWHAKRFHMQPLWGFKLAIRSCQKTFRSNYRSSISSAVITDRSYLTLIQFTLINNEKISIISNLLAKFCRKKCSVTFDNSLALTGNFELPLVLFKPFENFDHFFGPCRFSWFLPNKLNIWIHPSMENDFLNEMSKFEEINIISSSLKFNTKRCSSPIELSVSKNKICRFQLIGPKALIYLNNVFKLVSDEELDKLDCSDYKEVHKWWQLNSNKISSNFSSFQSGMQICLLLEDPRLFRAQQRSFNIFEEKEKNNLKNIPLLPQFNNNKNKLKINLWDWNIFEAEMLPKRLSNSEFEKICSGKLVFPSRTDFKIPIILILHLPKGCKNSLGNIRVDFLCPSSVSYDFWLAFNFSKCKPFGLQNFEHFNFERGIFNFPKECLDCSSGKKHLKEEIELIEKNAKNSHRCKLNFICLKNCLNKINLLDNNLIVLRERLLLKQIDCWLKHRLKWIEEENFTSFSSSNNCLLPIFLKMFSKGVPKRFSLIYANNDDLKQKEENKRFKIEKEENEKEKEEENVEFSEQNGYNNKQNNNNKIIKEEICNFLPLLEETFSKGILTDEIENKPFDKQINLNKLFPLNKNKKELKTLRNKRKKEKKKQQKINNLKKEEDKNNKDVEECEEEIIIDDNDKRKPIGLIINGSYSFIEARGTALGYALLPSLKLINSDRIVYVQNNGKKGPLYKATIEINFANAEI